jgi:ferrous iron transport protein A
MSARLATLDTLRPGQTGRVLAVEGEDAVARRLVDLGFWPGSEVLVVRRAPLGDPIQVRVGGYRLALGRDEGRRIRLGSQGD